MSEKQLSVIPQTGTVSLPALTESEWNLMWKQAEVIAKSGLVPNSIASPDKVIVVMMTGRELGMPTMTALRSIDVIQGQPAIKPQAMIGLIERSGLLEDIRVEDDGQACTVTMTRAGRAPHSETFSMDDARQMMTSEYRDGKKRVIPLAEKYNWKQMPATMRKWRAIAACAKVVFPDVILGLYTTEEFGDARPLSDDGDVIEGVYDRPDSSDAHTPPNGADQQQTGAPEKGQGTILRPSDVEALINYAAALRPDYADNRFALNGSCLKACGVKDWSTDPVPGGLEGAKAMVFARAKKAEQEQKKNGQAKQQALTSDEAVDTGRSIQPCKHCGDDTDRVNPFGEPVCEDCAEFMARLGAEVEQG